MEFSIIETIAKNMENIEEQKKYHINDFIVVFLNRKNFDIIIYNNVMKILISINKNTHQII